jgi:hypothetical protein
MKKLGLVLAAAAMVAFAGGDAIAAKKEDSGNGAPSGHHFTLNLIGHSNGQKVSHTGGSVIHVRLEGKTIIDLCSTDTGVATDLCAQYNGFVVIDSDGYTDGYASFGLPNPDPTDSGNSEYSLFIRGHGKTGTEADTYVCVSDDGEVGGGTEFCDTGNKVTTYGGGSAGGKKFTNVSRELLYIYSNIADNGKRVPLFNSEYEDYYWTYDNKGLRVTQMRFYWCETQIDNVTGAFKNDDDCWN